MMHMQHADQVDGDQLVPLRRLGFGEGLEDIPAGVIDEHIDGPELGLGCRNRRIDTGTVGDVAEEGGRLPAVGPDRGRHGLGSRQVEVEHRNARALLCEAVAACASDATATASNNDRLAFESLYISSNARPHSIGCIRSG